MIRRGFLQLTLIGYAALAAGIMLAAASGTAYVQTKRLHSVQAEYAEFKAGVKAAGEAQEARTQEAIERQKRESADAEKRSQRALADIRNKYDGLRNTGSSRGLVPPVPDTTALPDAAARDSRLLEVLRVSEEQTRQLEELQGWVQSQQGGRP